MRHFIFSSFHFTRTTFSVLFFFGFFFSATLHSQSRSLSGEKKLTIHFESDSYALTDQSKASIDSLIKICDPNPASCKVSVVGFTDNTGNYNYNQELSENRSKATVDYFKEKGFARTTFSGKSSSNAIGDNSTEIGKFENRRVEITISKEDIKVDHIGGIEGKYNSSKVNAENGGTIKEPSGTTIQIPANAFVDKNGNAIKGEVDLVYYEYKDPIDFILGNIPMDFKVNGNSQPFNSAGMFKMLAYHDGQEIYLQQGKNIDMNFAATQNIPNLNFYKFDTLANNWVMLKQITDGKGADVQNKADVVRKNDVAKRPRVCNFYGDAQSCQMDQFQKMFYVANMGQKYAQQDGFLLQELLLSDSVKKWTAKYQNQIWKDKLQIAANNAAVDSQSIFTPHQYRLVSKGNDKSKFTIRSTSGAENEFACLRKIAWQFGSENDQEINDSLLKKKWDNCSIMYDQKNLTFTISLSDSSGEDLALENVKMIFSDKVKKKDRVSLTGFYYGNYVEADSAYHYQLNKVRKVVTTTVSDNKDLWVDIESCNAKIQRLAGNNLIDRDSLFCFWQSGKQFMEANGERNLDFEDWLGYFDQNKKEMFTRYSAVPNSDEYKIAMLNEINGNPQWDVVVNNNPVQKPLLAQQGNDLNSFMTIGGGESKMQKGESIDKTKEVFKSLSISSLGVYNCDQISRLSAPLVNVNANYTNEKNEPLNIVLIYVVDSSFNGILRYDGLNNYKPSYFPISGSSKNTLIAFDENFTPYIFTSEEFAKIDMSGGVITQTFTMKKMTGLKEKDDLEKQLTTK